LIKCSAAQAHGTTVKWACGSRPFNSQVSINEAIQSREERVFAIQHDGADAPYLVKCVWPYRQAAGTSEAASNWRENTASQNMFLNIFFLHPTMHGGALLDSWDFHAFYALWFGHCGLNHRRCRHRRGGRPSRIWTFRTGRGGAVTLAAPLLEETHPFF
jgi:hypothetical protein